MAKSIMEAEDTKTCYICGCYATQGYMNVHHVFQGSGRRTPSEKYGLKVHLCYVCHNDNKRGVHNNKELADKLHREGQQAFERVHGSREKFMEVFGKNYL